MMKKIATDLEILSVIYNRYHSVFKAYAREEPDSITRFRVPIDIHKVARECGVDEDLIFGRLYYHFNKKYSYRDENGERIIFFTSLKHEGISVNLPLVASVLADLEMDNKNYRFASLLSLIAIVISVFALGKVLLA